MNWLPSSKSRYFFLGASLLAVVALIDGLCQALRGLGGFGFMVVLWACFATAAAWLYLEPIIDRALLLRKINDPVQTARINRIAQEVADQFQIPCPQLCVYDDKHFDMMVVGIGKWSTIFISVPATTIDDFELKAILAHEYGHIRLRHAVTRIALYGCLLSLAMLSNGTNFIVLPANLFMLWTMRQMEYAADKAASEVVGVSQVTAALNHISKGITDPPTWQTVFSTHPTFAQRINRLNK